MTNLVTCPPHRPYQQEGDQHRVALYEPLALLTQQAESPEQLEALL